MREDSKGSHKNSSLNFRI